ncbi:MAG: spermidine/putrescine ABC transporter substrate-binding protein [Acidimicrobiia bacterium]|nr:spermidine/putrescine ABC transporter substrate-binding protein [Acidimicrobiia bacterium]
MKLKRKMRFVAAMTAVALVAAACGGDDDAASAAECEAGQTDGPLAIYNWTEYMDPELKDAFAAEFGVEVTEDNYDSNEAMQPIINAGGSGYDFIVPSDYMVSIMIDAGDIQPLNKDAIPNISNLSADFASGLPYDPEGTYTAPYQWGTTGLGVDLSVTGEDVPRTWGLIFDADLAAQYGLDGQVATLLNDPRETLGAALKYLGYSLNTTSEAELTEAQELVTGALDRVAAFDSDQYDELLVTGDSAVAHGYSGNFLFQFLDAENPDQYTYFVPEEGGTRWIDNMAIPKDAPHPCTAHTFIDFLLDAERGAQLTNWNLYASPNEAAVEFIDQEVLDDPIVYPTDTSKLEEIEDTGDFETNFSDSFIAAKG